MSTANLFTDDMAWVQVPAPLLGTTLAEITDVGELQVLFRCLWHISRKKGSPRPVTAAELAADKIISDALGLTSTVLLDAVEARLESLAERGVLAAATIDDGSILYVLATSAERAAIADTHRLGPVAGGNRPPPIETGVERTSIFSLYEQNIGALTPLISERLTEAAELYPAGWLHDAIGIAVEHNARNWRYVTAILERWQAEGRGDGEPGRDSAVLQQEGFRKAFQKYARRT